MADTKFTPGPWVVSNGSPFRVMSDHPPTDAEPWYGIFICDTANNQKTRTPENAANARLIAAGPEMYKALQNLSNLQRLHYGNATLLHLAMIDAAKEIDAVLAKAVPHE